MYAIYDVTGDYDALLIGRFRDRRDLDRFVKHALQDPHVERSNTQVVLNRVKEDRRVPVVLRGEERPLDRVTRLRARDSPTDMSTGPVRSLGGGRRMDWGMSNRIGADVPGLARTGTR